MKPLLFCCFLFCFLQLSAQSMIKGKVTDSDTHRPLEMATVTLTRGTSATIYKYALTDKEGQFSFSVSEDDSWQVHVTYLGYRKESRPALTGKEMVFQLKPEAITLKEVEIKGGRIYGRQDTVRYDLARFVSGKDQNIKEALKKLPGIDVNEQNGEIRYNGKAISQFTVEGMDVTGGRYNQITENLKTDAVESAEVIEHFQPIRSLRNKMPTDNVALNLKLKPEVRSRWLLTLQAAGGYGDRGLYSGKLNALQLARERQGIYSYKVDHTGKDLLAELNQLTFDSQNFISGEPTPELISQPVFSLPLEKDRLLDNTTHLVSLNRLYRKNEAQQSRFTLNYLYDDQRRNQGTDEIYFYPQDTIHTSRQQVYGVFKHDLNASYNYENNQEHSFIRNLLEINGTWTNSREQLQGNMDLTQHKETGSIGVTNRLNVIQTHENKTTGFRSYVHYSYHPSELHFGQTNQSIDIQHASTDNHAYYQWKKNGLTLGITGGWRGELLYLKQQSDFKAHQFQLYATPMLMWERHKIRLKLSADAAYIRKPHQSYTDWHIHPYLHVRYQINARWEALASATFEKKEENVENFYPTGYWQDYRTYIINTYDVPENKSQSYTLYLTYKRTVKELFWTFSGSYWTGKYNRLTHSEYKDGLFTFTQLDMNNRIRSYYLNSLLSKGFYDWNMKTALEAQYIRNEGKQAGQGSIQDYRYEQLSFTPKISWTPLSWFDATYQATFACNRSCVGAGDELPVLWNIRQKLNLGLGNRTFSIRLIGEHYYNQLDQNNRQHVWMADAEASCIYGKWRFSAYLHNLFNQKEYCYTTYSAVQQYTSWIKIRPREFLVSVQYQL